MEPKKISFGFKKTLSKPGKVVAEEQKEYIECVEEKSIKVVGGEEIQENLPIVIPAQPNSLRNAEKLQQIAESVEKGIEETSELRIKEEIKIEITENETLDQMAVRELLEEAKKEVKVEKSDLKLLAPENRIPDGAKESSLEDYESIPVAEFGMAMLRGMGWDANQEKSKYKQPELRPKGLGLGADKVVKDNQKKSSRKENEDLTISKNGYVKIVTGKYSNYYGQVVSLDEDNGRVMVNIPMKKETVSLSEFMVQPVTKSEYDRESKVINKDSYDAYKKIESDQRNRNDTPERSSRYESPKESSSKKSESNKDKKDRHDEENDRERNRPAHKSDRDSDRRNKYSDQKDDKSRRRDRERRQRDEGEERNRRNRSSSDLSSPDRSKKSKHKKKRDKSSDSESSEEERRHKSKKDNGKRDIDKKRKGKKKKRDRDRSPNYKKHRK